MKTVVEGTENGVVLEGRRDGVVPFLEETEDGDVQGIGGVVGEDQAVGVAAPEEVGQALPGALENVPGLDAKVESGPPRVDAELPIELIHEGVDGLGLRE